MAKADLGALLMEGPKKKPSEPAMKDEADDELDVIAEDLIAAVKAGDASGVASALRAAHSACADYDEE